MKAYILHAVNGATSTKFIEAEVINFQKVGNGMILRFPRRDGQIIGSSIAADLEPHAGISELILNPVFEFRRMS